VLAAKLLRLFAMPHRTDAAPEAYIFAVAMQPLLSLSMGDELPELWRRGDPQLSQKPRRIAERKIEPHHHARSLPRQLDQPLHELAARAPALKRHFFRGGTPDAGPDLSPLAWPLVARPIHPDHSLQPALGHASIIYGYGTFAPSQALI